MPRAARKKSATDVYHIVVRGANHQMIFEEEADYKKYLNILLHYKEEQHFDVYAYCLMNNHIHLLIHTPETSLENIFRRVNTTYSMWFNMKYDRVGFLQQGRYFSEPVEDMRYLNNVVRYIHQNPFKAGLEVYPGEKYPWSSIYEYENEKTDLVDTSLVLEQMGGKDRFMELQKLEVVEDCMDLHKLRKRIPDDVAMDIIKECCDCASAKEFQELPKSSRDRNLKILNKKGLSVRQINRLTGISKGVVERVLRTGKEVVE